MTSTAEYVPHGAAREMWKCRADEVLIPGPAGTGKTRGVLEKVLVAMSNYPGARALLVRKTRASMTESVLVIWETEVAVGPDGRKLPWVGDLQRGTRRAYSLPNGSEVVIAGMDNSDRIMSSQYDIACAFESTELTENDLETITTRLRNGVMPYQQLVCDCNPTHPGHFLKRRADAGRMAYFPSSHKDNPRMWDGTDWTVYGKAYLKKLENLTGHRRERLLLGRWAAAEGLVYPEWDETVHIIDAMPAGWEAWPRYRSIDFGFTNPFVCGWWATDPDGRLYLYREIYRTQRTVADHAQDIIRLSGAEKYSATVADHDAEDRATLAAAGIVTIPAKKSVTVGIQAVTERLRIAGDGKPRLYVLRSALAETDPMLLEAKRPTCLMQEMDCYVWAKGSDGKPNKEEPVKEHDHHLDALRYMVQHLDAKGVGSFAAIGPVASSAATIPVETDTVGTSKGGSFAAVGGRGGGWSKWV